MSPEYDRHKKFKKDCAKLDRSYGSDWNTCLDPENLSPIRICSHGCCAKLKPIWTVAQYRQLNHLDRGK